MSFTLPLFDDPLQFDRQRLADTLRELAGHNILIGTSSWKYEGWIGQIYSQAPYMVRGRFSKKQFEQNCLSEYAATFPIVCGDFSFYQFPSGEFWQKLFASSPAGLQFAFKVPEEVTCKTFPSRPRYGPRAGQRNETFLSAELFEAGFLKPLEPWRARIPVLIFEFGTFSKKAYPDPIVFFADLDEFLGRLPGEWRYAVEVRNEEFLQLQYFEMLRRHKVAHVFNAWTRMPPLHHQIEIAEAFTADFTIVRGLLRTGRPYETAVKLFSPYDHVQDENPKARDAMRQIIDHTRKRRQSAYLFINNRLEGNAPITIDSIVHGVMSHPDD